MAVGDDHRADPVADKPADRHAPAPVTVLIPAFNLQRYLTDTVRSAQRQTYSGPLSILILDDGSTDGTLALARSLAAETSDIQVHTQTNQGRAKTRNRLVELARSEHLAWIDGDDIASPTWIEEQMRMIQEHPGCVAVGGQGYAMNARRYPIGPIEHPLDGSAIDQRHLRGEANAFFQSCVTVRRSAVLQAGGYDEAFPAAEDYSLWLRLAEVGELRNLPSTHLYYRVHPGSANWTINVDQRQQGHAIMNEARQRRGLPAIPEPAEVIPPPSRDDWNRRIYWINIALRSGNPYSALSMLSVAIKKHPASLLLWLGGLVALCDTILFLGNRTARFEAGKTADLRTLPSFSCYRLGRKIIRHRRQWVRRRETR